MRHINKFDNCDNVVGVPALGYQAIVGKDTRVGDLMVAFTAGTQLGFQYAYQNNLHRHEDLNLDKEAKGYLEDNLRIKALRFRGHRSDALLMPLSSLDYLGIDTSLLREGDSFDEIGGVEICKKYQPPRKTRVGQAVARVVPDPRVDEKMFPKHFDTPNFFLSPDAVRHAYVTVTQKLHGTSLRVGHVPVKRKLSRWERIARRLGVRVDDTEYVYVYGSRNVIKDPGVVGPEYYDTDIYTQIGQRVFGALPKGFILFGEIIGWVPDTSKPIQADYTYDVEVGQAEFLVYRVVHVNPDGYAVDLSWDALKQFCTNIGVRYVPELWRSPLLSPATIELFLDCRLVDGGHENALPTSGGRVDEGVCIRTEGITPVILKAKSPEFLRHESQEMDKGGIDMETSEGVIEGELV